MNTPRSPDYFRNVLAFALVGAFVACIPLFVFKDIPGGNEEIIVYMVGQLSGMALTALGSYFVTKVGQDTLDIKRADNTGKMADAIVAAAASTPATGGAGKAADAVADADAATEKADETKTGMGIPTISPG